MRKVALICSIITLPFSMQSKSFAAEIPKKEIQVSDVQKAAARYAGFDLEGASSWKKYAGRSAWLPELRFMVKKENFANNGQKLYTDTPYELITFADGIFFEVSARWNLDRLLFNKDELDAARQNAAVFTEYKHLMDEVTKLYFKYRDLGNEIASGKLSSEQTHQRQVQLEETGAILNAVTGYFYPGTIPEISSRKGNQ